MASDQKQGYGGLLGGNVGKYNVNTGMMEYLDAAGNITTNIADIASQGFNPLQSISPLSNVPTEYVDAAGKIVSPEEYAKLDVTEQASFVPSSPSASGVNIGRSSLLGKETPDFIKKAGEDLLGLGGASGLNDAYGNSGSRRRRLWHKPTNGCFSFAVR
jgi:hypothetical protein